MQVWASVRKHGSTFKVKTVLQNYNTKHKCYHVQNFLQRESTDYTVKRHWTPLLVIVKDQSSHFVYPNISIK